MKRASNADGPATEQIEKWFIRYGLPHFDNNFDKHSSAAKWSFPILITAFPFLVLADAAITRAWLAGLAVVVAVPVAVAVWRARRRHGPRWSSAPRRVAVLATIFVLTGPTAARAAGATLTWTAILVAANVFAVVIIPSSIKLQLGSVIRWVTRRVLHEVKHVGNLAVKGVSMLFLITILGFFSNDLWHIAYDMGDVRLVILLVFFVVFGVVFLWVRLKEELDNKLKPDGRIKTFNPNEVQSNWNCFTGKPKGLPRLAGLLDIQTIVSDPKLDGPQRLNMRFYLIFCQVIQVGLLTFVVWLFFLILGRFAITDAVLADWFGKPQYPGHLFILSFSFLSTQLIDASGLMAILAGIFFTVSALTDGDYRAEFFDRTMDDLIKAVCVRCAYLTLLAKDQPPLPAGAAHDLDQGNTAAGDHAPDGRSGRPRELDG